MEKELAYFKAARLRLALTQCNVTVHQYTHNKIIAGKRNQTAFWKEISSNAKLETAKRPITKVASSCPCKIRHQDTLGHFVEVVCGWAARNALTSPIRNMP
ncbi:MAG: hypothetical protein ACM3UL_04980 [Ignavibacteria bacterium]